LGIPWQVQFIVINAPKAFIFSVLEFIENLGVHSLNFQ